MATTELTIPSDEGPSDEGPSDEGPSDEGSIPARLYRPGPGVLPVIVYYHGGGWVIGSLETHDGLCRHLAEKAGAAVLSVDYRLAPEHPFPAAVDDAYAALRWIHGAAATYDLDANCIAVAGDSAGGNLAAVAALMARDADGPPVKLQALLYPGTDMRMGSESHQLFREHLLTPESILWFRAQYLPNDSDKVDWRASPLLAKDLSGVAPAYVMTAGFDPLRDEGKAYAERLEAAGVTTRYRCFEGQIHGFLTLDLVIPEALDAIANVAGAIAEAMRA